jgi:tRNA(His) guanylyltransferase
MPKFESLGERMKFYEAQATAQYLQPFVPWIIRLDGRAFHTFTRGFNKPFDTDLIRIMQQTTEHLVKATNACIGYTQSDEITLVLYTDAPGTQLFFDGRRDKINSILAAICSVYFSNRMEDVVNKINSEHEPPVFDCRCFTVPNKAEALNCLIWREQDAVRNSVQMVGQHYFSPSQLHQKSCNQIQEMLFQQHKINWNDLPDEQKRGTYVRRRRLVKPFTTAELEALPEHHHARTNPDLVVEREEITRLQMPILSKVINRDEVVFDGADPITLEEYIGSEEDLGEETPEGEMHSVHEASIPG